MQRWLTIAALVLCAGHAVAEAKKFNVDLGHTRILFSVSHLGLSQMPGIFRDIAVDFAYDHENPAASSLDVTIQAASVDMFHDGLNDHLRNEDFFNVAKHPTITFKSTKVEPAGDGMAKVTGDFTMMGVTKPLTFDVKLNKFGPHPRNPNASAAGFGATGVINRGDFGMGYGVPMIGGEITFTLSLEANDAPPRGPAPPDAKSVQ